MTTVSTVYSGDLRTLATHVRSGQQIITDAPLDNNGKGEAFSPSDLMSASLGSCMLTIMGIAARTHQFSIEGTTLDIAKVMASNPRRVSEIRVRFYMPPGHFNEKQRSILDLAARTCPVALSLHPDLKQTVTFQYPDDER
ncbi:MAG TPA: OsmC family protein [Bacteroidia bacterium]|nr:OsmC family protein [Bacteroidia bacterium]